MIYKESIKVPFENVQDGSGTWEVKIDMRNTTTRLVGTFTDDADVVHYFDFFFNFVIYFRFERTIQNSI